MILYRMLRRLLIRIGPAGLFKGRGLRRIALPLLFVASPAVSLQAANFLVTSTADDGSSGTLRWAITQANASGAGTHNITFSLPSNSTIVLSSQLPALNNAASTININGTGASGLIVSGSSPVPIFLQQSGQASITNLVIAGTGGITKNGSFALTRSGNAASYTGETRINTGALNYNSGGVIPPASRTYIGDGTGAAGSALLNINIGMGTAQALDAELASDGVVVQGNNRIVRLGSVSGAGGELRLNSLIFNLYEVTGTGGDSTFGGSITGGNPSGSLDPGAGSRFSKGGPSTLTLTGNSSYISPTFVNEGNLRVESNTALGSAGVNSATLVRSGASLQLANNVSLAERIYLNGMGQGSNGALRNLTGNNIVTGGVTLGWTGGSVVASDAAIGVDPGSQLTINSTINGSNGLTKLGTGTLVLNGSNTYSGGTTVLAGIVQGNTQSLQGNIINDASVTFQQSWNGTYSSTMSGSGSLTKEGTGALLLQGPNTYTGGTIVNDGSLVGTTTSVQGAITNHANVTFDQSTNGTYSGNMSGTGNLTKTGTGALTLQGANTYSGGTTINDGSLIGTTTSLQGAITNNTSVMFDQSTDGTYAGAMSGSGSLTKSSGGTLVLSGANSYTGGTTVSEGILQGDATSLQGTIVNHANITFEQITDGSYAGTISGDGSLTKLGMGALILSGAHTHTGGTTVDEGLLAINGSLSGHTTVGTHGRLGGSGVLGGDLTNHGTVGAGNSIGTLTVQGNYTQATGSAMLVEINAAGTTPGINNDLLQTQNATLNGGSVNVVAEAGAYTEGTMYRFLSSTNSIQGEFAGIETNMSDFRASLGFDFEGGLHWAHFILIPRIPNFLEYAEAPNHRAVADYLVGIAPTATGDLESVIAGLGNLYQEPVAMRSAFDMISGQIRPTLAMVELQNTTLVLQQLAGRLRSGGFHSASSGGFESVPLATSEGASIVLASYDRSESSPRTEFAARKNRIGWNRWGLGYGLGGSASTDGNAAGLSYGMGGNLTGIERNLDSSRRIGFFGGYQGTQLQLSGLRQTGQINGGMFGSYLHNDDGFQYLTAISGLQFGSYGTQRHIQFDGIDRTASGTFSGWQGYSYWEQGFNLQTARTVLQPYAALQYVYLRHNMDTETGADSLNLNVSGLDAHSLRSLIGGRWQIHNGLDSSRVLPEIRTLWLHEFLDTNAVVNSAFAPVAGGGFAVQGLDLGRDWAIVGGGFRFQMRRGWTAYCNYDSQFNAQQVFHLGSGGVQSVW